VSDRVSLTVVHVVSISSRTVFARAPRQCVRGRAGQCQLQPKDAAAAAGE
jgi:hypothetical protein